MSKQVKAKKKRLTFGQFLANNSVPIMFIIFCAICIPTFWNAADCFQFFDWMLCSAQSQVLRSSLYGVCCSDGWTGVLPRSAVRSACGVFISNLWLEFL